ncbi:unnamed protein product [Vitrella brassicaformis CCMP3155]|uniref:Uncharacterized protein n=1 Tax=Vitrella brassicaformis (strain CCMP3155) TaxID=1169540 RepID=A0A0G4GFJ8_VITBC|nr:unnamed protein product [Vitrella brassicaformis CCMP3155]|eukprot:CEM28287.1 unnamed protein product [Vitrella brassicaformis CCMP3155]
MQSPSAPPSPSPPSRPLFQPADLFDLSLPVSKMAAMAMSTDANRRAALRSQITNRTRQQELLGHTTETINSTLLNSVQQHIDKAISRLGLQDVFAFDIGDDVEGGLKIVYLLEEGTGEEWRAIGRFLRLAFIYRLTPNTTRPLQISADALPTATALCQLPLALAIYKMVGRQLTHRGTSLELQQTDNGHHWIASMGLFRVLPLGELPAGHPYVGGYKRTDPVIRCSSYLFRSFSAFLLHTLLAWWYREQGVGERRVVVRGGGHGDRRYDHLLTEGITEDQGVAVDCRYNRGDLNDAEDRRLVIVKGFRPNDIVAARLLVTSGGIHLFTTEAPVANWPQPLAVRYPISMPLWCGVLRRFGLESDVINRGSVLARDDEW